MTEIQAKIVDGNMHISFPSVIVKAGVLGKSLLTQDEMEKSLQDWNNASITMRHPKVGDTHVGVEQAPEFIIGYFSDSELFEDKIKGRMWLNTKLLSSYGVDGEVVLDRAINNEPIEVSTSYFYDKQQGTGQFNGESYEYATLNITPDHIAILPDQTGNCSWSDGCGIPRVNADEDYKQTLMIRRQLTHNQFDNPLGDTPMDEDKQQVNCDEQDDAIENEADVTENEVEVNEDEAITEDETTELDAELDSEASPIDSLIEEIGGFEQFASAIRSVVAQEKQETNSLVANAAQATGLDEEELRKLSNDALRSLSTNKRENFTTPGNGLRANSERADAGDGWTPYPEVEITQ